MDLLTFIKTVSVGDVVSILLLVLSFVQIAPIKINPWSWLARHFGRAVNGEVMAELKSQKEDLNGIHKEVDALRRCNGKRRADDARNRILRFDDELRRGMPHSLEFWRQIIRDCDFYVEYCKKNDDYINGTADSAIKNIRTTYDVVKEKNAFI